jgi:hypothetical protein
MGRFAGGEGERVDDYEQAAGTSWENWDEWTARHMGAAALFALRHLHGWQDEHVRALAHTARYLPDAPYEPTRRLDDGTPRPLREADMAEAKTEGGAPEGELTIHQKLWRIRQEIGQIEKSGYHPQQKFTYIQEHKVFELLRPLLEKYRADVGVDTGHDTQVVTSVPFGSKGSPATLVTLGGRLTFVDVDSGEQIQAFYVGQGIDTQDKASNKAQTYLVKYALQKFFRIPTEHIDDEGQGVDEPGTQAAPGGQAPPPAEPGVEGIGVAAAEKILGILEREVKAGHLDANKVKGKIATLRVPWSIPGLASLTQDQKRTLAEWVGLEVAKAQAAKPADGVPA